MSESVAAHVVISGRVQGVGFRWHLEQQANAAGLSGWCRNRYDGCVEALLCGDRDSVQRVVAWCHDGPTFAYVDSVEVDYDEKPIGGGFCIRD